MPTPNKKELSEAELNERIAILKRFRQLLQQQRNTFQKYLLVLENQHEKIESNDGDSVAAYTDLANQIVKNLASLQKVIVPMRGMYKAIGAEIPLSEHKNIDEIQANLEEMRQKVLKQNERNRILVQNHMKQLKNQLGTMNALNPYRGKTSVYSERTAVGSLISIES